MIVTITKGRFKATLYFTQCIIHTFFYNRYTIYVLQIEEKKKQDIIKIFTNLYNKSTNCIYVFISFLVSSGDFSFGNSM